LPDFSWWANVLITDAKTSYAVNKSEGRVNLASYWSINFLCVVRCNWLVRLAFFLATASKEFVSKIYSIWIPIWHFVALGYQHLIANFYLFSIFMEPISVWETSSTSVIPVTIENIVGEALFTGMFFWLLYGRDDALNAQTGQPINAENNRIGDGRDSYTWLRELESNRVQVSKHGEKAQIEKSLPGRYQGIRRIRGVISIAAT
jgi:hypothetical protein